ncbi:IS607 family element RNA-guided endonuclease TnpB [Mycolicibacterium sp. BK634]|uniref:IS607 family element RNA-guided endonuclease TnpB n=2 Tax=Mycobacteriaceae TaxID=1762 RepID=UPI00351D29AB
MVRAYRFALDPNIEQQRMLQSHCGAQRFAFNWALGRIRANLDQRAAERSYGVTEEMLTPYVDRSAYGLRKSWNEAKEGVAPWWRENSKEAYASGIANLAAALGNWANSHSGARKGRAVGFPRFKSKKSRLSCRFTTGAIGLPDSDRRHVRLPRIGVIRTFESTRKLARRIDAGSARIRSATITKTRGRWHVAFSVEVSQTNALPRRQTRVVGVDVGVRHLAVLSAPAPGISDENGMVANPRQLAKAQRALSRIQRQAARRQGPDRDPAASPSKRWLRSQKRMSKLHASVANSRADGLHKLTTNLSRRFGVVVVEDLNVAGMLRNRSLSRRISDAAWGELRRQLAYKTQWTGGQLIVANRFYASSKTCSACGAVKAKLRLSERLYCCDSCGLCIDRDYNAARNLASLATTSGHVLPELRGDDKRARWKSASDRAPSAEDMATGSPRRGNVA